MHTVTKRLIKTSKAPRYVKRNQMESDSCREKHEQIKNIYDQFILNLMNFSKIIEHLFHLFIRCMAPLVNLKAASLKCIKFNSIDKKH